MAERVDTQINLTVAGLDETVERVQRLRREIRATGTEQQRGAPVAPRRAAGRRRTAGGAGAAAAPAAAGLLARAAGLLGPVGAAAAIGATALAIANQAAGFVLERLRNPDRTLGNVLKDAVEAPVKAFLESNLGQLINLEVRRQALRDESRAAARLQRRDLDARLADDPEVRIRVQQALVREQKRLAELARLRSRDDTASRTARGF